jgi:hypothetical protein
VSDDGVLRPIQESDYFSSALTAQWSEEIDRYFDKKLEIFPGWETERKPDRFHVLFARQIEERFPVERDIRGRIHRFGRRVFVALCTHTAVKRLTQSLALAALVWLAALGPEFLAPWAGPALSPSGLTIAAMAGVLCLFGAVSTILFVQYRYRLTNDSYELSREVVQRTRELQNLFTNARALADQAETEFQMDGKAWGQRALYLTRLVMWIGARMEYLEKYVQMELWRVRRERYWMRWFSRFMTPLLLGVALWGLWSLPVPIDGEAGFRLLQGLAAAFAVVVSTLSYFVWRTPTEAVRDKLGVESWVRYASLNVDNTVGDQVRRDKERLVEYRALTRGR